MTGGQSAPTTPATAITTTAPYGAYEPSFNLPALAEAAGASYVARWTTYHVRQLTKSMNEVLHRRGFCFIEVLSPCPTLYQRRNKMGDGLDAMKYYREASRVSNGGSAQDAAITKDGEIVVGKFVDRVRPDYMELMRNRLSTQLGDDYVEVENLVCS
jgi:2-oxoglutarate ferredoxin oxidoreductase subunit beta